MVSESFSKGARLPHSQAFLDLSFKRCGLSNLPLGLDVLLFEYLLPLTLTTTVVVFESILQRYANGRHQSVLISPFTSVCTYKWFEEAGVGRFTFSSTLHSGRLLKQFVAFTHRSFCMFRRATRC